MPNPASSQIQIEIPGSMHGGTINVYNNSGKKVFSQQFSGPELFLQINTSHWPVGIYQVAIISKKGEIHSGKVIVK